MKVKIEIDGAAADTVTMPTSEAPPPPAPPEHVLAKAVATGALNAGPAPTVPQSPGDVAPAAAHEAVAPPQQPSADQSAGAGPGRSSSSATPTCFIGGRSGRSAS